MSKMQCYAFLFLAFLAFTSTFAAAEPPYVYTKVTNESECKLQAVESLVIEKADPDGSGPKYHLSWYDKDTRRCMRPLPNELQDKLGTISAPNNVTFLLAPDRDSLESVVDPSKPNTKLYAFLAVEEASKTTFYALSIKKDDCSQVLTLVDCDDTTCPERSVWVMFHSRAFVYCHKDLNQVYVQELTKKRGGFYHDFAPSNEPAAPRCFFGQSKWSLRKEYNETFGQEYAEACIHSNWHCYQDPYMADKSHLRWRRHHNIDYNRAVRGNMAHFMRWDRNASLTPVGEFRVHMGLVYDGGKYSAGPEDTRSQTRDTEDTLMDEVCLARLDKDNMVAIIPILETYKDFHANDSWLNETADAKCAPTSLFQYDSVQQPEQHEICTAEDRSSLTFIGMIIAAAVVGFLVLIFITAVILVAVASYLMKKEGKPLPKKPWEARGPEDQDNEMTMGVTENASAYGTVTETSAMPSTMSNVSNAPQVLPPHNPSPVIPPRAPSSNV